MNTTQFIAPVTFEEFRFKFKLTLGKMKKDTKIEYSVVQLHNQFKVVGLITKSPFISTFKIDFAPDIPRRFVDCDMPALVLSIKTISTVLCSPVTAMLHLMETILNKLFSFIWFKCTSR